jgi:hypothetical protein
MLTSAEQQTKKEESRHHPKGVIMIQAEFQMEKEQEYLYSHSGVIMI